MRAPVPERVESAVSIARSDVRRRHDASEERVKTVMRCASPPSPRACEARSIDHGSQDRENARRQRRAAPPLAELPYSADTKLYSKSLG
jgi:hypothetical protein